MQIGTYNVVNSVHGVVGLHVYHHVLSNLSESNELVNKNAQVILTWGWGVDVVSCKYVLDGDWNLNIRWKAVARTTEFSSR